MAKKETLITGVDIGSSAVKVCQLQKTGKGYNLLILGSAAIPPDSVEDGVLQEPEEVGKVIAALFKNLKIKNKKIGLSISGYSVIVKKIRLEVMEEEELDKYINDEAEQYLPFERDEVYLDFQDMQTATGENEKTDVMLVAAKKDVVDGYLDMVREQKLNPVLVDIDGFALENIWEEMTGDNDDAILVDIGGSKMSINIISGGLSVLARDIAAGSEQLTGQIADELDLEYEEAEKLKLGIVSAGERVDQLKEIFNQTCIQWVLEIKKAMDLYLANHPDRPVERMFLSGGGSKVKGLKSFIERETGLEVISFNPFANMNINTKKLDPDYVQAIAPEMVIAAGLAIRPADF
jgi:type IV pilus assembly protein PilM